MSDGPSLASTCPVCTFSSGLRNLKRNASHSSEASLSSTCLFRKALARFGSSWRASYALARLRFEVVRGASLDVSFAALKLFRQSLLGTAPSERFSDYSVFPLAVQARQDRPHETQQHLCVWSSERWFPPGSPTNRYKNRLSSSPKFSSSSLSPLLPVFSPCSLLHLPCILLSSFQLALYLTFCPTACLFSPLSSPLV